MGVDIVVYRQRIGMFGPGRFNTRLKQHEGAYNPCTSSSDIHYRTFATLTVTLWVLFLGVRILQYADTFATVCINEPCAITNEQCQWFCFERTRLQTFDTNHQLSLRARSTSMGCNENMFANYFQLKLLRSADVELNPGPFTDKDEILNAVRTSKEQVLSEIKSVRNEVQQMRSDVDAVRRDCADVKASLHTVEQKQSNLERKFKVHETEFRQLREDKECLQLDIDEVYMLYDAKCDEVNKLDDKLEKLESLYRKDNMRIFGLPEFERSAAELKSNVLENVVNVAIAEENLSSEDILDAFRVGANMNGQPKVTVVKFRNSDIKSKLYAHRDTLRESGIRISDDLTMRQREKLQQLKTSGRTGYFHKGELKVRTEKDDGITNSVKSRMFLNANRRLVPSTIQSENEHMEEGTSVDAEGASAAFNDK